jgi:hypothetical protein
VTNTITVATTTSTFAPSESAQIELARLTLSVAVPIEMAHLSKQDNPDTETYGPNDYQREAAHDYIRRQRLGEAIMFVSRGETGSQMALLCQCAAILSFCPGGVSVCGLHFEAERTRK